MKSKILIVLTVLLLVCSILPAAAAEVLQNPINPVVFTDRLGASMTWILTDDDYTKVTLQYERGGVWYSLYSESNEKFFIDGKIITYNMRSDSGLFNDTFRLRIENADGIVYSNYVNVIINNGTMSDNVKYIVYKASDASAGNLLQIILTMLKIVSGMFLVWFAVRYIVSKVKNYVD